MVLVGAGLICLARGVRAPGERMAWLTIGAAVVGWALGNVYYTAVLWDLEQIPTPSVSDALWIVYYPVVYVGVALLLRARIARFHASLWVDGVLAALTVGALTAALVFEPVLDAADGNTLEVATNLAYPVGDLVLLGMVTGGVALTGWKPGVTWSALAVELPALRDQRQHLPDRQRQRHVAGRLGVRGRLAGGHAAAGLGGLDAPAGRAPAAAGRAAQPRSSRSPSPCSG